MFGNLNKPAFGSTAPSTTFGTYKLIHIKVPLSYFLHFSRLWHFNSSKCQPIRSKSVIWQDSNRWFRFSINIHFRPTCQHVNFSLNTTTIVEHFPEFKYNIRFATNGPNWFWYEFVRPTTAFNKWRTIQQHLHFRPTK